MTYPDPVKDNASPRSSSATWIGVIGIFIGIGGLTAGGLSLEKLSRIEPTISTQQDATGSRLKRIEAAIENMAPVKHATTEQKAALEALRADLAALHEEYAQPHLSSIDQESLRKAMEAIGVHDSSQYGELAKRMAILEERNAHDSSMHEPVFDDTDMRSVRFLMLEQLVISGKPFDEALDRLCEALGDGIAETPRIRNAFKVLSHSEAVPTQASLYTLYVSIPRNKASEPTPYVVAENDKGIVERSLSSLSGLVKIEKIDADAPPHERMIHADAMVKQGHIIEAAHLVGSLPDADREAYEDWLSSAARYEAAQNALSVLRSAALEPSPLEADPVTKEKE
ncbi:MAG: hypothetical protein C0436_04330 [Alphaproteobacteria bacterium]|nr:hypothetical protein [Alphaproteobacteria bacterium]